jgi:glycerol-3-phosphate O-acyltransferase
MQNDENTFDLEEELQDEESVEETEAEGSEEAEEQPDLSDELAQAKAEAAKWRRLAEKKAKSPQVSKEQSKEATPTLSRDEAILFAKGLDEEAVEKAKKIAALEGIRASEAVDNELFIAWQDKRAKEKKQSEAALGASKTSAPRKAQKDFTSSDLTEDEHRKLFEQAVRD